MVVTRPGPKARELTDGLQGMGAAVIPYPVMKIGPPVDPGPLETACNRLASYDFVLFTSANSVRAVGERVPSWPATGPRIAVVGDQTAKAVRGRGWPVDLQPDRGNAEGLLATLKASERVSELRFLFPRAEKGREVLVEGLTAVGAAIDLVIAYRALAVPHPADETRAILAGREIDLVTFTSGACAEHFLDRMQEAGMADIARRWPAAVIGPVTRQACEARGLRVAAEAEEPNSRAFLEAIGQFLGANP